MTAPEGAREVVGAVPEPGGVRFILADRRVAPLWLLVRLYVGYEWLRAGWDKLGDPAWVGAHAGTALSSLLNTALLVTATEDPDASGWYASFLRDIVIPHAKIFAYSITLSEVLVGIGLILGFSTGIVAFCGSILHANFLLVGAMSSNPLVFILAVWLILAWRVAGYYGLDRWLLPLVGVPGVSSVLLKGRARSVATEARA